jgi:hypothetical protein
MPLSSELADAVQACWTGGRSGADSGATATAGRPGRARTAGRAADAAGPGAGCRAFRCARGCWSSATARAKGTTCSCTPLPAATCTSGWRSCWPGGWRAGTEHLFAECQRPGPGDRRRANRWRWKLPTRSACSARTTAADVLASLNSGRTGAAALSRDRARGRAGVRRLPRRAQEHAPAAGLEFACSTRSSASTTPATACWRRPTPRCWRRNWTCSTWPTLRHLADCRWTSSSCVRPARSACR